VIWLLIEKVVEAERMAVDALDRRAIEFLMESNAIEGINNIDYRRPENARSTSGHVGAFQDSQQRATAGQLVTVEQMCQWQAWITSEQLAFGHPIPGEAVGRLRGPSLPMNVRVGQHVAPGFDEVPGLVSELFEDLRERVNALGIIERIALIGDTFQRFEAIHPFVDGNGRTGRLLANHLVALFKQPLIVFRASERPAFYAAHSSKKAMRRFIIEKMREAMFGADGHVWERTARYDFADRYVSPDGTQSLVVECHLYVEAADSWR
jgi:Fic family protein